MTLVSNETSTGLMNPLEPVAEVMRKYPDVSWCVDAVSSMAGIPIEPEKLGIDFLLAGTQKAFGLPPGLAVVTVSERALELSIICTVPTYDEAENILLLSEQLLALGPKVQVVVIDDNSPDGTWKLVGQAAETEPRLRLLHRITDRGRGSAGREGFLLALKLGADLVIEMDADFSHHPRFVPDMVEEILRYQPVKA